jgi:hypothetical protein
VRWLPGILALAFLGAGCGPRPEEHARAVERSEVRSGGHYLLRSELRPGRGTLGDVIGWRLTADVPRHAMIGDLILDPPDSSLEAMDADTRRYPHLEPRGGRDLWTWARRVQGFALGPIPLPSAYLVVHRPTGTDTIAFPPDTLFVDSLTAAPRDSIEPDRGALSPGLRPLDRTVAAAGLALLLALAAALLWAWRRVRRRTKPAAASAPPAPPALLLGRALEALRRDVDRLPRDVFYQRLSDAVRGYLEAETGIPALERTTREIEDELERRAPSDTATRESVGRLLRRSDLAKFARAEDERGAALSALDEARALPGRFPPRAGG